MVGEESPLTHLSRESVVLKMNGLHCEAVVRTPNAKDKVGHREHKFTRLSVVVRCVSAPDAESRIDRATSILLAAAEECAKPSKKIMNPEEDPPRKTHTDDVGQG